MTIKQKTLAQSVKLSGVGLHTGCNVNMTLNPAPENYGFKFKRIDLDEQPVISALASNVLGTARGTVLVKGEARVSTIEHTLAAFTGLDLDNILVEVDGPEAPILDGSSKLIVEAIEEAGIVEQNADREYFVVKEKIQFKDEKTGSELIILPDDDYAINTMISFDSPVLYNQYATLNNIADFKSEISMCRTFVFLRELEVLLQNNLVKGGDLDNAIVIIDREISQDELDRIASLFEHEKVIVKEQGVLNNLELHYDNEMARHKLLDVVGDLTLAGMKIKGRVLATRPGHAANVEFAKLLQTEIKKQKHKANVPTYDPTVEPMMDVKAVKQLLPHRYPFLLVDKIINITEDSIVGIKNVTCNEEFFCGHFPEEPVMPGVLITEAMAQIGGCFVLNRMSGRGYSTYFMKMDNIKFRKKVVPGDTLIFKIDLTSPIRRGIANMHGTAFVGDSIVAEGDFMAQVVKNKEEK